MPKCILIVDDESEILEMTSAFLRKRGYDVITASDGESGLAAARHRRPDLVLTDVLMPNMDGYAFYKELKNDNALRNLPVLIITGRGKMEDSFKVMGVDGFITKPFTPDELAGEIEHIFQLADTRQPAGPAHPIKPGKKILALIYNKTVADDMTYQSQRAGYQLKIVANAADIIAKVVSFLPNVIIIDVQPKDMSAAALVDVLSRLPQCADQPVIAYSYYATEELGDAQVRQRMLNVNDESERFLRAGGTKYIGRYNHFVFIATLTELLNKKK